MDGSEPAGLAAYQNSLVSAENDDVTRKKGGTKPKATAPVEEVCL